MCLTCGEAERGCGFRKVGGYYLEGGPGGMDCGRLPIPITACASCGQRPKFTRTLQKIDPRAVMHAAPECNRWANGTGSVGQFYRVNTSACSACPFYLVMSEPAVGLMWVGAQHYTPQEFAGEAATMGVSKRIAKIPKWLEPGKSWVLLAHEKAVQKPCPLLDEYRPGGPLRHPAPLGEEPCPACGDAGSIHDPGVFMAFRVSRVVKIVDDLTPAEELERLRAEEGVEPIIVDHNDVRHQASKKTSEEENGEHEGQESDEGSTVRPLEEGPPAVEPIQRF